MVYLRKTPVFVGHVTSVVVTHTPPRKKGFDHPTPAGETYVREKAGSHFPGFQSLTIGDVNYVACDPPPAVCASNRDYA